MAKTRAELKAALDAARKAAAAATKKYQGTKSYDVNYAQIKADNDGAINDLNAAQAAYDKQKTERGSKPKPKKPAASMEYDTPQDALNAAKSDLEEWTRAADSYPTSSAAYKNAIDNRNAAQKKIDTLQKQVDALDTSSKTKESNKAISSAQTDYNEAVKRAKDKGLDPNLDPRTLAAKKKLDDATGAAPEPVGGYTLPKPTPQPGNQYATGPTGTKPLGATGGKSGNAKGGKGTAAVIPTAEEAHAKAEAALQSMGNIGMFSIQMGLINSDPSLKEVFYNDVYKPILAGQKPVDINKFKADITNSKWFTTYAEPAREAEAAKFGDPGTWLQSTASAQKLVKDTAMAQGYDLSADQITTIADYALHKSGGKAEAIAGLVMNEVKSQIMSVGKINANGGLVASGISGLKATAGDYGVSHLYSDKWYQDQQDAILKGTTTQAAVEGMIKANAKSAYSALAPQIDAGMSVKSIMSPYAQLYGTTLELDPNAVNVSDPQFAANAFMQDPTDPMKQVLKPLWQYQQDLKKDPRWGFTDNARADLNNVGHTVLQNLGLTY